LPNFALVVLISLETLNKNKNMINYDDVMFCNVCTVPRKYPRGKDGTAAATDSSRLALQQKSEIYISTVLFL
jgi:hypothetical protein